MPDTKTESPISRCCSLFYGKCIMRYESYRIKHRLFDWLQTPPILWAVWYCDRFVYWINTVSIPLSGTQFCMSQWREWKVRSRDSILSRCLPVYSLPFFYSLCYTAWHCLRRYKWAILSTEITHTCRSSKDTHPCTRTFMIDREWFIHRCTEYAFTHTIYRRACESLYHPWKRSFVSEKYYTLMKDFWSWRPDYWTRNT